MEGLETLFRTFFDKLTDIAMYIIAVKMATNLVKNYEAGNYRDMFQDLIGGGFAYGALLSVLKILDSVKASIK